MGVEEGAPRAEQTLTELGSGQAGAEVPHSVPGSMLGTLCAIFSVLTIEWNRWFQFHFIDKDTEAWAGCGFAQTPTDTKIHGIPER